VSDLRGASASLEAVAAVAGKGTLSDADRARLAEVQNGVTDSFAKYKQAEQKFLDIIVKQP
jgi:hypothetical protein